MFLGQRNRGLVFFCCVVCCEMTSNRRVKKEGGRGVVGRRKEDQQSLGVTIEQAEIGVVPQVFSDITFFAVV